MRQVGTFNGNPLVMAAAQATLLEVLTDEAYASLRPRTSACSRASTTSSPATGCRATRSASRPRAASCSRSEPLYEYRDYATKVDEELSTLAWLYHMNHGIFMTPGVDEQWTLSVAHTDADLQRYIDAFEAFARDVTAYRRCASRCRAGSSSAHRLLPSVLALDARDGSHLPHLASAQPCAGGSDCSSSAESILRRGLLERKREALTARLQRGRAEWETTPPDHLDEYLDTVP